MTEQEELKTLIRQVKALFKYKQTLKKKPERSETEKISERLFRPPVVIETENNCLLSWGTFFLDYNECIPIILKLIATYTSIPPKDIQDVIDHINEVHTSKEFGYSPAKTTYTKPKQTQTGWIYYLLADNNVTKIGKTTRAQKARKKELDSLLPYETKILAWIKVTNVHIVETDLHDFYKKYRIKNTEWFHLPAQEIEAIKNGIYPTILEEHRI